MNIDLVMINHYLGLSSTGIYSITFFFGTLIIIPARALSKITAVVIADFWKSNDTNSILDIYKKSTSLLVIAASFIFVGIWANIDNVFKIIGPNYESGKYVILFIGLANVIDAFSGSSSLIIANSNKYRWLSIFLIIYTVAIIITNIIFIPVMGIAGAAFASFISRLIYVLLRFIFLNRIYHFQPYSYKHILIVIIAVATWYLSTFIPTINNFLIDILVRSISVTIVYIFLIFYANISDDFNKTFLNVFSKIIKINKQ
jgi:O-antigen/teichoic acid export membrane protein